jgi:hypothetical protein
VAAPDIYDPAVNPLFRDVLAHYGVVALPCRTQDPARKAYVSLQEFALDIEVLKTRFVRQDPLRRSTNASSECLPSKGSPSIRGCRHNRLRSFRSIARNWYGQLDDK